MWVGISVQKFQRFLVHTPVGTVGTFSQVHDTVAVRPADIGGCVGRVDMFQLARIGVLFRQFPVVNIHTGRAVHNGDTQL